MTARNPNVVARHARALAQYGLAVVPLHPRREDGSCDCRKRHKCPTPGKHPRILWKDRPAEPPTEEELERWWRTWPDSGIGVILGDRHCALDIDHHPGGADGPAVLARLQAEHDALPNTWRATSPAGGGGHLYFANHGRFTSLRQIADGIQLRAGRHVMVLPPTYGRAWIASPRQAPLADLPVWVADLAQRKRRQQASGGGWVAEELLPDNRHPTYVRVALELARMRLPAGVIAEMLAVVDHRMAQPPKKDRDELDSIAAWAVEEAA